MVIQCMETHLSQEKTKFGLRKSKNKLPKESDQRSASTDFFRFANEFMGGAVTTFQRVVFPLTKTAFLSNMTFFFMRAMTTISAVIFLVSAKVKLAAIEIIFLDIDGRTASANAMCTILILIVVADAGGDEVGDREVGVERDERFHLKTEPMAETLHLNSDAPKYSQISRWLIEMIQKGRFGVHEKLPSESKLSELFQVNRNTVRQAISDLVAKGLVQKRNGVGFFCHRPVHPAGQIHPPEYLQFYG